MNQEELETYLSEFIREYINYFNRLERNIAYSLWHSDTVNSDLSSIEKIYALSFCKKIKNIKKIITEKGIDSEFATWLNAVEDCRSLRNQIVHGNWEVLWFLDNQIRMDACQIENESGKRVSREYTIETLSKELIKLKKAAEEFSTLRKMYQK